MQDFEGDGEGEGGVFGVEEGEDYAQDGWGAVYGDDLEGLCGVGGERGVHVWEFMYTRGRFMSMYAKTNTVL